MLELMKLLNLRIGGFFTEIVSITTSRKRLNQLFNIPLYSNALYLMIANATSALGGFIFWVIAARSYSAETVGQASAAIAAIGLLASFAILGLGYGLIRFLPHAGEKTNSLLNSSFTINGFTSLIASFIFLGGLSFWSPALAFLRQDPVFFAAFVFFTIALTLKATASGALIAKRRSGFYLVTGAIFNVVRLPSIFLLSGIFHFFGIFGSWGISLWVAVLFNIFLFLPMIQKDYRPRLAISREVKRIIRYSAGNYIADLLRVAPSSILPIMVINLLGAEHTAFLYIAFALVGIVNMIAESTSLSLFAEGSHEEEKLEFNVRRSLKMVFLILIPAIILVWIFADKLLLAFGNSYSESATTLLRILTLSTIPFAINTVYLYIMRVEKKLAMLIVMTAFLAVTTLALSYVLIPEMGITGTGIAWVISQGIVAVVITVSFIKKRLAAGRDTS